MHLDHHSFPTRRSSDLQPGAGMTEMRLRAFLESLPDNEIERVKKTIDLADVAPALEGNAKAVWFERLGLAGNVTASRSRSEEHTSELQSLRHLVCRLLL